MTEISYKAALLARARTYHLSGGVLSRAGKNRPVWEVPLAKVEDVTLVDHSFQKSRMIRLDLHHGGKRYSLALTQPLQGWHENRDTRRFLSLASAVMTELEAAQPGIEVTEGQGGRFRTIMFTIGVVTILAAMALLAIAIIVGMATEKLIAGVIPVGLMLAFGGYISYAYRPWERLRCQAASLHAKRFEGWLSETPRGF